jgi:hypothetical protein
MTLFLALDNDLKQLKKISKKLPKSQYLCGFQRVFAVK